MRRARHPGAVCSIALGAGLLVTYLLPLQALIVLIAIAMIALGLIFIRAR